MKVESSPQREEMASSLKTHYYIENEYADILLSDLQSVTSCNNWPENEWTLDIGARYLSSVTSGG